MTAHLAAVKQAAKPAATAPALRCPALVPACSNFSIQYNFACASIVVAIMLSHNDERGDGLAPDYPEPRWAKEFLLSIVFVGSVAGMLVMGYLGDLIGIKPALVLTNLLVVVGALGSAVLSIGDPQAVWGSIAVCRFCLGVGVGGSYPLSAARAAEGASSASPSEVVAKAAAAFVWQAPGSCAPYVLALGLLQLPHRKGVTSLQFRTLLAVGAVPAFVVLLAAACESSPRGVGAQSKAAGDGGSGELNRALRDVKHWRTLVGTAGTWFLYDVALYGTVIFTPTILSNVFGSQESLTDLALRATLMACVAIVASAAGLAALPRVGAKGLNTAGLAAAAALFALLMTMFRRVPDWHRSLFCALGAVYFAMYWGPNMATYVLPVVAFPCEVRSTFHGLSSAAAKVGAMVGALAFPVVNENFGESGVMAIQACVCAAGAVLNHLAIEGEAGMVHQVLSTEEDAAQASALGSTQVVRDDLELADIVGRRHTDLNSQEQVVKGVACGASIANVSPQTRTTIEKGKLLP